MRPEHQAPPEIFYNEVEAQKYTQNSRIMDVQSQCSVRAVELLCLPPDQPCMLLDLGCGSGLSGEVLTEQGHHWVGMDISQAMLDIAVEREVEGDIALGDMGQGMPFRAGMFDGAVSVSALQWLCNADKSSHIPKKRLSVLFRTLFACLARGARAVFQFYPENDKQVSLIVSQAMGAGFGGGIVVDYPNSSKAKKVYLTLMCGGGELPRGLQDSAEQDGVYNRRAQMRAKGGPRSMNAVREKIRQKKERRQKQGKRVAPDSKYTGRPRSSRF